MIPIYFILFLDLLSQLDARIHSLMAKGEDRGWYCSVCGKTTRDKQKLANHIESHHIADHPGLSCDLCGAASKTRHALSEHKRLQHKYQHHQQQQY